MTKLQNQQRLYTTLYGKAPPNSYKNNTKWLEAKIKLKTAETVTVIDNTTGSAGIPTEIKPLVFEKLAVYLKKRAEYLKNDVVRSFIVPCVEGALKGEKEEKIRGLKAKIASLKSDIAKCPNGASFEQLKKDLKERLKESQEELLQLNIGANPDDDGGALDIHNSQLY